MTYTGRCRRNTRVDGEALFCLKAAGHQGPCECVVRRASEGVVWVRFREKVKQDND